VLLQVRLDTQRSSQPAKNLHPRLPTAVVPYSAMSFIPAQKSASSFDVYSTHQYDNIPVVTLQRSYPVSGRSISFGHALPQSTPDDPVQRRRASKVPKRNLSTKHHSDSINPYKSDPRRGNFSHILRSPGLIIVSVHNLIAVSAKTQSAAAKTRRS
jgi:hypothetical protein